MGNFGIRMREIAFGALLFNGISAALRNFTTGLQNALRQSGAFVTTMSNLKGAALNATAPLVSALTPALTALANAAAVALSYLSRLFAFFTGKSISGLKATAKAMGGAASSAKELKNNMLGIDELNVVDSGASGGGGGGLGNIEPNYGFEGQNDFLDTLMAAIESGDWAGAGILLADKVNSMVESVDAYSWGQKLGTILQNGIVFGYSFLTTFDWNGLGAKLAGFVNGSLAHSSRQNSQLRYAHSAHFSRTSIGQHWAHSSAILRWDFSRRLRTLYNLWIGALSASALQQC